MITVKWYVDQGYSDDHRNIRETNFELDEFDDCGDLSEAMAHIEEVIHDEFVDTVAPAIVEIPQKEIQDYLDSLDETDND